VIFSPGALGGMTGRLFTEMVPGVEHPPTMPAATAPRPRPRTRRRVRVRMCLHIVVRG